MIYVILFTSLLTSVVGFLLALVSFKESRKLNNKWKIFKKIKTDKDCGFRVLSS